jgi:hypothetical protein
MAVERKLNSIVYSIAATSRLVEDSMAAIGRTLVTDMASRSTVRKRSSTITPGYIFGCSTRKSASQCRPTPYDVEGWPRKQAKLALLIAINARTHLNAVRALADALRIGGGISDPFATADKLIRAVKARHPDIAHAIGSDAGVRLMRRDSELAERIMMEMARAVGIVPLCVHDSFVVPASQAGRLREAMENALPCGNAVPKSLVETHLKFATMIPKSPQ